MTKPRFTYRISAMTLAFMILISSVGYGMDVHYCSGMLKSVSLIGEAQTCHEIERKKPKKVCPHHANMKAESSDQEEEKPGCCKNTKIQIEADQDIIHQPYSTFDLEQSTRTLIFTPHIALTTNNYSEIVTSRYRPPPLIGDIHILYNSFLI